MTLRVQISTGGSVPIHRQVADQICRAILSGALKEGDQLPSVRALARPSVLR